MASGSIHQLCQSPIACGICEGTEDVDSYCLMCKGPMCGTCSVSHTQTPIFRKHRIVSIAEGLTQQEPEEDCSEHPTYVCSMHCNVCHKLVCNKCLSSGKHKGHDVDEIEAALRRVRQQIQEYHDTLENKYLSQYRTQAAKITQEKAECKQRAVSLISDINNKRSEFITVIHKVCDDMISKVDDEEKQQSLQMDISFLNKQETIKEIEILMKHSKGTLTKLASQLIKFDQERSSLSHFDVQEAPKTLLSTFVQGTINREKVAEQIGKLVPHKHLQIDTSIIHRTKLVRPITSIYVVDENQAWVSELYGKDLKLVDTDGKAVKHINTEFNIDDFAVTTSGDFIVTDYQGRCIRIMTQTGQVTNTININPNYPTGVCVGNNNQEIVVCVNASNETYNNLVVYSRDGKKIRTINYTDKPVGGYISQRVTQNSRGDYCVTHRGHNKVYVVDTNGGLRWTYDLVLGRLVRILFPVISAVIFTTI